MVCPSTSRSTPPEAWRTRPPGSLADSCSKSSLTGIQNRISGDLRSKIGGRRGSRKLVRPVIPSGVMVRTITEAGVTWAPSGDVRETQNAGWPFAVLGSRARWRPDRRRHAALVRRNSAIGARPTYSCGAGGIASQASSVSSATTPSTSPAVSAVAKRRARSCSCVEPVGGDVVEGRFSATALRARCRRALHRGRTGLQHRGDVSDREAEHVAQEQRRGLTRRETLQRGDERQLDRLSCLVADFGRGVRLQPRDLVAGRRFRRVERRDGLGRWAPLAATDRIQAPVGGDAIQPGAQRRQPGEAVEATPRRGQRVLQHIVRVRDRTQHPVAVHVQLAQVWIHELTERLGVSGSSPVEDGAAHQPGCCHQSWSVPIVDVAVSTSP